MDADGGGGTLSNKGISSRNLAIIVAASTGVLLVCFLLAYFQLRLRCQLKMSYKLQRSGGLGRGLVRGDSLTSLSSQQQRRDSALELTTVRRPSMLSFAELEFDPVDVAAGNAPRPEELEQCWRRLSADIDSSAVTRAIDSAQGAGAAREGERARGPGSQVEPRGAYGEEFVQYAITEAEPATGGDEPLECNNAFYAKTRSVSTATTASMVQMSARSRGAGALGGADGGSVEVDDDLYDVPNHPTPPPPPSQPPQPPATKPPRPQGAARAVALEYATVMAAGSAEYDEEEEDDDDAAARYRACGGDRRDTVGNYSIYSRRDSLALSLQHGTTPTAATAAASEASDMHQASYCYVESRPTGGTVVSTAVLRRVPPTTGGGGDTTSIYSVCDEHDPNVVVYDTVHA